MNSNVLQHKCMRTALEVIKNWNTEEIMNDLVVLMLQNESNPTDGITPDFQDENISEDWQVLLVSHYVNVVAQVIAKHATDTVHLKMADIGNYYDLKNVSFDPECMSLKQIEPELSEVAACD